MLKDSPSTDAETLGKALVDGFIAQNPDPTVTLALIDTSRYEAARAEVGEAAKELEQALPDQATAIGKARASTLEFGQSSDPSQSFNVVDFGDLLDQLASQSDQFSTLASQAAAALQAAVVYEKHGAAEQNAHGLSLYFPSDPKYYQGDRYTKLSGMKDWQAFLDAFFSSSSSTPVPKFPDGASLSITEDDKGNLVVEAPLDPSTTDAIVTSKLGYGYSFPESSQGAGDDTVAFYGDVPAVITSDGTLASVWDQSVLTLSDATHKDYAYLSVSFQGSSALSLIPLAYLPSGVTDCSSSDAVLAIRVIAIDTQTGELQSDTLYAYDGQALSELTPAQGSHLLPLVNAYIGSQQFTQQPSKSGWFCSGDLLAASPAPEVGFEVPKLSAPAQQAFAMSIANAAGQGDALAGFRTP